MLTLKMTSIDEGKPLSKDACRSIIERWWSARIINPDTIHGMSDGMGVVFDIQNSYYERFLDNYDHIKNQEGLKLDFIVSRCQELPEMEDEESNGGFIQRNNYNHGGHGGSGSFGGRSSRGGFEGGRGGA